MLDRVLESENHLGDFRRKMQEFIHIKSEKVRKFYDAGLIKRFLMISKSIFFNSSDLDVSFSQEEIDCLKTCLTKYREADNNLWKADLKSLIVPSILERVKSVKYSKDTFPKLMEESIIPCLEKLGLCDLIPEINVAVNNLFLDEPSCRVPSSPDKTSNNINFTVTNTNEIEQEK